MTIPSVSINNNNNSSPCMTPTKQQMSKPMTNVSQQTSKPQTPSSLSTVVSPLTTFQSNNNNNNNNAPVRNTSMVNTNITSPLKGSIDDRTSSNDASDTSSPASNNPSNTYAKVMQQSFKEGIQTVKQSIQYNVCDIIESDTNSVKYNDYLNFKNTDDENEEELFILNTNEINKLNGQNGEECQINGSDNGIER